MRTQLNWYHTLSPPETQVHVRTNDPQVYFVKNEVYIDFNSEKIHKSHFLSICWYISYFL